MLQKPIGKLVVFDLSGGGVKVCSYFTQEELVHYHAAAKKEYEVIVTHVCKSGVKQYTPKLK